MYVHLLSVVGHRHILKMDLSVKATDAENKNKCACYWKFHYQYFGPGVLLHF